MATQWSFPVAALPANPHRDLPVFQVPPNWKRGVTETLAWLTDVMSSETAVEQRRSLRRYPRRAFEYEFLRQGPARARIENFLAGVGKRDCLVPLWHEQFTLPGVPNGAGYVAFPIYSLSMREFAEGDLVLLTTMSVDRWAVLTVVTVDLPNDAMLLAAESDVGFWPPGTRIVPLRRAKMLDSTSLENVSDRVATTRMRFTLQDADERFSPSWGYCSPLWRIRPDRQDALKAEFNRSDFVLDFASGVVDVTDPGDRAQISQSMSVKLFSREAVWGYRSLLYSARGRARRFYVPTYMDDLEAADDIQGGLEFDAKPNGFSEYFLGPQDARKVIGIEFTDGRPGLFRTIVNVAAVLTTTVPHVVEFERFTLDAELPPILKREIERISFIVPSRFDQDTMEIFHAVADCAAVSSSVVTRSSTLEGMPPIECWVTSRPYPVVLQESMESNVLLLEGKMYSAVVQVQDSIAPSARLLTNGTLKVILHTLPLDERLQSNVAILGGTIQVITVPVETYTHQPPEDMTSGAKLTNGVLRKGLINYQLDIESVTSNASISGGTLS